jgi:hypothetical protein
VSVFAKFEAKAWPFVYAGTLHLGTIAGGTPTDPKVADGWIRAKGALGQDAKDDLIRQAVAEVMVERGVSADEAVSEVAKNKSLNGFKRDRCANCPVDGAPCAGGTHPLYIEGRQLKAAIKEAASVAYAAGKLLNGGKNAWGRTSKGILGFIAEHVCVVEDRLYLGVSEPSGVNQRFVHTFRGAAIQYEEYVTDAKVDFTVKSDHAFTDQQWAMVWLTGEQQGLGASRSQGYGRYEITRWEKQGEPMDVAS